MPCSCLENVLAITIYIDFSVLLPSIFGYRIIYGDGIMYVQINRSLWACLTNRNAKSVGLMESWKHFSISNNLTNLMFLADRYDSTKEDTAEEIKRWKTNFRCALASATNIVPVAINSQCKGKLAYKVYEILEKPDPRKVEYSK
mgnify:CR=1 FL=1